MCPTFAQYGCLSFDFFFIAKWIPLSSVSMTRKTRCRLCFLNPKIICYNIITLFHQTCKWVLRSTKDHPECYEEVHNIYIYLFFKFHKHLLKKHLSRTKLILYYSTYITRHHSIYCITVLIGLITSAYFLPILTVTY